MPTISDPRRTHLFCYANFATKPIVECFSTIFTRSFHFNHIPSCLVMQKIFVTYSVVASCHGKKYHFLFRATQPPHYMVRMSCALHQNHHIILARTNHHCFFVLYFRTTLPGWVMSFSNFHYEYNYFSFMSFSETTVYLIRFLHHTQASCVRIHHTDFSQNKTAYLLK